MKHKSLKRILIFAMFFVFTLIVANVKNVRAADDITIIPNGNGQYTITGTGAVTKAVIETRFENKESVKHIIVEEGITEIRDTSFADFSNLETVEIRANITVLEGYIFSGCEKLTTVILPDSIEEIEYGAFSDCSNLQTFTVGPNVKKIGNYAFENCIKLIKFEMGTSVTTLGEKVFYECKNLEEVEVPYTVTEIGSDAFSSCNGIKIICLQGSYAEEYEKQGLHPKTLSNALESAGTVTSALVPWNTCGVFMATTLGISTVQYAPWAIFNWLMPIVVIIMAFMGITVAGTDGERLSKKKI